ncbi:carboxypeptidase regulatory-like domain-containing protein [Alteromonas sp. RKMC-009]|uniref:carboxypeptidase regulatory-like domain-containing protein n=1 Tax=Alteromonas sp. RKMC-009 TaxID=2267264 RepID=UPI000E6A35BE|nr:carboxypeptidase regulatory-like domain-containing protein [Alteromonas sp. RKMC-009]AYA64182.1 carboxypeptidase regulatory-like domain-containing protein [Alteromonas sp. RKMC-009]
MTPPSCKPTLWRVFLFVLSVAYLIPEAIFNAQLVSLIGLGTPQDSQLEQLEVYGRAISGIGATLLLADFLPARYFRSAISGFSILFALACVVWPTVYFGQKIIVERVLIASSSAEQREQAVLSAAFRDALALNAVSVTGLEYDTGLQNSSENLTFLALFGGLLYADNKLATNLENYKHQIVRQFVQKQTYRDFDLHYQDFSSLYVQLSESYEDYAKGSNTYNQKLAGIPQQEKEYWQSIEQKINQGWSDYQQATKTYVARAEARAQKYGPRIFEYHKQTNQCLERYSKSSQRDRRTQCIERLQARYKSEIDKAGLGYVEPNYWLIEEDVSGLENTANTAIAGVITGGLSTLLQALSLATGGDGGIKDKRYKYTDDPTHYQRRILAHPNFQAQFQKDTGYPMGIPDLGAFRNHDETQQRIRNTLKTKGLALPADWRVEQRLVFSQAVANKVKTDADAGWNDAMQRKGLSLPVNLQWQDFQLHPSVQSIIAQKMGDMYVDNVHADWSQANFKQYVLDPNIEKRTLRYIDMISDARVHFENGGKYAEAGKQALRSVLIPPISMFLSLFLICLTILKLPIKAFELFKPDWQEHTPKWSRWVIKSIPILLICFLPSLLVQSTFTARADSPVNHFLEKVEENGHPVFSTVLGWTLHAQPILHPLGLSFEAHTGIYKKVEPLTHKLAGLDEILPITPSTSNATELSARATQKPVPLTVISNVEGAAIRIMNIKPKYQEGMLLAPGNYEFEIRAAGYQTYRRWHRISEDNHNLEIPLDAL